MASEIISGAILSCYHHVRVREMNEGVKRIYSEMESAFLHEPKYSEPGNKVVLTLENNIVSRTSVQETVWKNSSLILVNKQQVSN